MTPKHRVAITGVGAASALGIGYDRHREAAMQGRVAIGPLSLGDNSLRNPIGAAIHDFDARQHMDAKQIAMLDRVAQLALVAAREATGQSGIRDSIEARELGVIFGAANGFETLDSGYRQIYGANSPRLHPFTVPRTMSSAAASVISMDLKSEGPSFAVSSACASAAHAIGVAVQMIRSGMVKAVVTGGAEAPLTLGVVRGWEALRVLSAKGCRPFSRDRDGLVLGEGAAAFVLEDLDHARARGAPILGEVTGFGMTSDGADMTAPRAETAARAIRIALDDAGLAPDGVDYVNAHGTGTQLNDKTETAALRLVFQNALTRLPVSSTKSMYGHTLSAAGALDLVMTLVALNDGIIPPTMGFQEADPECDVDCVPNAPRRASVERAVSNSFAFGGLNAVLVVERCEA